MVAGEVGAEARALFFAGEGFDWEAVLFLAEDLAGTFFADVLGEAVFFVAGFDLPEAEGDFLLLMKRVPVDKTTPPCGGNDKTNL